MRQFRRLEAHIIFLLKKYGSLTRDEMVEKSHVPRSTLHDYLEPLIKEELIEKFFRDRHHSVRGRRFVYFRITEKYEEDLRLDAEIIRLKGIIQKLEREGEIIL